MSRDSLTLASIPGARSTPAVANDQPAGMPALDISLVAIPEVSDVSEPRPAQAAAQRVTGATERRPTAPNLGSSTPASTSLHRSVGRGGANQAGDIALVQARLSAHGLLGEHTSGELDAATQQAIIEFQYRVGFEHPDGRVDPNQRTLRFLRMTPEALARQLARSTSSSSNSQPTSLPAPVVAPPVVMPATAEEADRELARLQALTVEGAERELAAGVRETSPNRSPRIDQYARAAGHSLGLEWCGNFIAFLYRERGMRAGEAGVTQFSNGIRATYFFNYRQYTDGSNAKHQQLDALREQHRASGSMRQFWTLPGSYGSQMGGNRLLPSLREHVVNAEDLPLRPGDIYMIRTGSGDNTYYHIGLISRYFYDAERGWAIETIEGNTTDNETGRGGVVERKVHYLSDPSFVRRLYGFGRPALGDFVGS